MTSHIANQVESLREVPKGGRVGGPKNTLSTYRPHTKNPHTIRSTYYTRLGRPNGARSIRNKIRGMALGDGRRRRGNKIGIHHQKALQPIRDKRRDGIRDQNWGDG
jgi:hypothetical protein